MGRKTTIEEIVKICDKHNVIYVNHYMKDHNTYVHCKCKNHSYDYNFEISFRNLKNSKHGCPKCSGKGLTTIDIIDRVRKTSPNTIILGKYENINLL